MIPLIVFVLGVWTVLVAQPFKGGEPSTISFLVTGPNVHSPMLHFDPYSGLWPTFAVWIAGVIVLLAAGYLLAGGQPRPEFMALIIWTIGSYLVMVLAEAGSTACAPPRPEVHIQVEGVEAQIVCYRPWSPGFILVWSLGTRRPVAARRQSVHQGVGRERQTPDPAVIAIGRTLRCGHDAA